MLDLEEVTLRVGGRPLLEGASLHLASGQRVALVGRNGTGKTSLLRLIAGELQADSGTVRLQPNALLGVVAQEAPGGETAPLEAVLAADRERARLLAEETTAQDPHRIGEIHNRLAEIGAHAAPARAARILKGLGFSDEAQALPLSGFSGGWRMRVALASVLFLEPDLLLLDEPTNHLDLEAAMWLEQHLKTYPRTLIIVSHDRDLLDAVPDKTAHLEQRRLTLYSGGYSRFERTRREKLELAQKSQAKQALRRAHLQAFVDRFRAKATKAKQAQSRLKMLEKMGPPPEVVSEPEVRFAFPPAALPAPPLITLDRVEVGYGGAPVLRGLDLRIDPDDRIALLGANGNGKSTFAKLIAGRLQPIRGEVTRSKGLRVGFFAQHQIEDLRPEQNAIAHLQARQPGVRAEKHRALLGRFGLTQEKAETTADKLSGGEKTRLCFALMCLEAPQILILDEPTNHLDIDSREALVAAVNAFEGAVIVISHDRHLVELTAERLWLVADGRVVAFDGDIESYRAMLLAAAREEKRGSETRDARPTAGERRQRRAQLRRAAKDAETALGRLTRERDALRARLANPATYENGADVAGLRQRERELDDLIVMAESRWLESEAAIETLDAA